MVKKRHKTSTTTVYQKIGKTDPKDPRRYKRLPFKIEKLTKHTVQMKKRAFLKRSGVSFRSAAEESRIEEGIDACTPGPSKPTKSTPGPSNPTKYKRKVDKDQLEMKQARKTKKNRIVEYSKDEVMERAQKPKKLRKVEYSEDESDEDGDSDWEITGRTDETAKSPAASGGENESSVTTKEQTPKIVGCKRKQGKEATRKSTRQRKGVDKMGRLMIHQIEHK